MGAATSCCASSGEGNVTTTAHELQTSEAVLSDDKSFKSEHPVVSVTYRSTLDKSSGQRLGLDVDYMAERKVLPVMNITGGLAEQWNTNHPEQVISKGDSIVEVNGLRGNVAQMLEKCKSDKVLILTFVKALTYEHLVADLEKLILAKKCGPILVRLSWHDAGVFSDGALTGGCPNAAMRFSGEGEAAFPANAGLPTVALSLLEPISKKYCPDLISHADLWALAANVAIRTMGGPDVPTRFGRIDAQSASEGVLSAAGRLPDGDKGAAHLREIFHPKGFDDAAIVALSGAHTLGKMHLDRSGFDGAWTEDPLKFDNSYFKDLLNKSFKAETTSTGNPQHRCPLTGTVMLNSDLALIQDAAFKEHAVKYAEDQEAFFHDFSEAWVKLQENGCGLLREIL